MTKYSQTPKNHMQVLEERELAVIFDYLTQHNQVENIESIFADVYHEPKPAPGEASPSRSRAPPSRLPKGREPGHRALRPRPHKSRRSSPAAQGGKPEQAQARPATRVPEKKVVDTRKGGSRQPGEVRRAAGVLH